MSSDPADDALAAAMLLQSLENCHVYLLSELPAEVVESLGVGALQDLHQADHILHSRGTCLVIVPPTQRTHRYSVKTNRGVTGKALQLTQVRFFSVPPCLRG